MNYGNGSKTEQFQNKQHKLSTFINPCVDMEKYFWHIHVLINGGETIATTEFLRCSFFSIHPWLLLLMLSFPCCCFFLFNWMIWFEHALYFSPDFNGTYFFFFRYCSNISIFQCEPFFYTISTIYISHFKPCRIHCTFHTVCDEGIVHTKWSHRFAMWICVCFGQAKIKKETTTKLNYNHSVHFSHIFSAVIFTWSATIAKNHSSRCTSTIKIQSI